MPAVSKAQARYMCGICHGSIPAPKSLTQTQACDFCTSQKGLPERKKSKGRSK